MRQRALFPSRPEIELPHLYEASVQTVDADLDFAEKAYRRRHGRRPVVLREDFCGTAAFACGWARRRPENVAIGVDLDGPTLDWGRRHNLPSLGDGQDRVTLVQSDVRDVVRPKVDVVMALNFSYWIFRTRPEMLRYFRAVRRSLRPGGIFVLDLFGGTEAMKTAKESRAIAASRHVDGTRVPRFTYQWEQARFDPVTHHCSCKIHFVLPGGRRVRDAYTYDWRFWLLPELRELLADAGFADDEVWTDDWDDASGETNGIYKKRVTFDNDGVWIGYLVGGT